MIRSRAYPGSHSRADSAADERVSQTMMIFHQLHAAISFR